MGLFRTLTTLIVPKKAEFTKRLISKRRADAESRLFAGIALAGTAQYRMRMLGLESAEYAVSPESTIVNVLEQYWSPSLASLYVGPFHLNDDPYAPCHGALPEEVAKLERERINSHIGSIEYRLTGNPRAATLIPEFDSILQYLRWRMGVEHPKNIQLDDECGYTDAFLQYAVDEAKYVFRR